MRASDEEDGFADPDADFSKPTLDKSLIDAKGVHLASNCKVDEDCFLNWDAIN